MGVEFNHQVNFVRVIECSCGEWEEMQPDDPRHKAQSFDHIKNIAGNNAVYACQCGDHVSSKIEEVN